jgi:hypothetical protein
VAEFDTLFAEAVQAVQRPEPTRLRLVFSPDHAARAAQENGYCSYFTFTLTVAVGSLALEAAVPIEQLKAVSGSESDHGAA